MLAKDQKKLYWFSLSTELETLYERHRFTEETDAAFCRRMVRRYLDELPELVPNPRRNGNWRTKKCREYHYQDSVTIQARLGQAGVTLRDAIASAAHLEPVSPIASEGDLDKILLEEVGETITPLHRVIDLIQFHVPALHRDSPGRKLLSGLSEKGMVSFCRWDSVRNRRYTAIDGQMYTHCEIFIPQSIDTDAKLDLGCA